MGSDRVTDDTEANTLVRPLYLFITIVIIKEGRTKKGEHKFISFYLRFCDKLSLISSGCMVFNSCRRLIRAQSLSIGVEKTGQ
jgi:hypothetical protein